jgi:hypothetical protein
MAMPSATKKSFIPAVERRAKICQTPSRLKPIHVTDHVLDPTKQPATVWSHHEVEWDGSSSPASRRFECWDSIAAASGFQFFEGDGVDDEFPLRSPKFSSWLFADRAGS